MLQQQLALIQFMQLGACSFLEQVCKAVALTGKKCQLLRSGSDTMVLLREQLFLLQRVLFTAGATTCLQNIDKHLQAFHL